MTKSLVIFALFYLLNTSLNAVEKIIIILGPPGSGKGTQTQLLKEKLNWPSLAVSAIKAQEHINRPEMLPIYEEIRKDQWTKDIFKSGLMLVNISKNKDCEGIILENWPRTPEALSALLLTVPKKIKVIELFAPEAVLLARVKNRQQCPQCGASYGHARREKIESICDECTSSLITRLSDSADTFPRRLSEYRQRQMNFRRTFEEQGIAIDQIYALGDAADIHEQIMTSVQN